MTVEKQNGDHLSESPSGRHTYLAEIRVLLMCAPLEGKAPSPQRTRSAGGFYTVD